MSILDEKQQPGKSWTRHLGEAEEISVYDANMDELKIGNEVLELSSRKNVNTPVAVFSKKKGQNNDVVEIYYSVGPKSKFVVEGEDDEWDFGDVQQLVKFLNKSYPYFKPSSGKTRKI